MNKQIRQLMFFTLSPTVRSRNLQWCGWGVSRSLYRDPWGCFRAGQGPTGSQLPVNQEKKKHFVEKG